ncbi:uncharacterized protein LOC115884027 [Sitophilus oryzae]|uniref:Uncharacterized protein LOC115884027 n=1 Tax=Sitophilus oryzae TaxID=7048 RepID=A0A6J2Y5Q9_SITOR|nr:uncharacterized protein LOC115884027 [Sitophilus oryzae]XP_030758325.1 uncharacterized protein LOC115884027 [Sitophilus oryzae]
MSLSNLSTLDRIQLEIKESIEREKELKNEYSRTNTEESAENSVKSGSSSVKDDYSINSQSVSLNRSKVNGFRKYTQNNSSNKGVMHKFLKLRGKLSMSSINSSSNSNWSSSDAAFCAAKITIEKGSKLPRNGFVSAEEKMKKELQDFQQRETELREERKKSLPNLMAALQLEDQCDFANSNFYSNGSNLKATKSMANLYNNNSDDGFEDTNSSAGGSLKPARSLAELCDVSDDDNGLPGTHSLILQFENMHFKKKSPNVPVPKEF